MRMAAASKKTADNDKLIANICVNYGGRWDIAQAARRAAISVANGEMQAREINEQSLARFTCLGSQPPPDLLIRTGGEHRISNFLLWQIAYTELYFTDTLWPDFDAACMRDALDDFARRQRRYGQTPEQAAP